jgi:gluconolactonase
MKNEEQGMKNDRSVLHFLCFVLHCGSRGVVRTREATMRKLSTFGIVFVVVSSAAAQDMPLSQVLLPGEGWQVVVKDCSFAQSLTGDGCGSIYIAERVDVPGHEVNKRVWRIDADGADGIIYVSKDAVVGLTCGPDGVYFSQPSARRIGIFAGVGTALVSEGIAAEQLAVTKKGEIYCTVPDEKAVYLVVHDAGNSVKHKVASDFVSPGALTLTPDGGTLIVGDAGDKVLYAFRVQKNGDLDARERYYPFLVRPRQPSDNAGLTLDAAGRAYATSREGVQVFDPTGRLSGVMTAPERAALGGVAFGGADLDRLYVACGGKVYVRKVAVKGVKTAGPRAP